MAGTACCTSTVLSTVVENVGGIFKRVKKGVVYSMYKGLVDGVYRCGVNSVHRCFS